jgi:hypothetical protein
VERLEERRGKRQPRHTRWLQQVPLIPTIPGGDKGVWFVLEAHEPPDSPDEILYPEVEHNRRWRATGEAPSPSHAPTLRHA